MTVLLDKVLLAACFSHLVSDYVLPALSVLPSLCVVLMFSDVTSMFHKKSLPHSWYWDNFLHSRICRFHYYMSGIDLLDFILGGVLSASWT